MAAQHRALALELRERALDVDGPVAEPGRQRGGRERSQATRPAAHHLDGIGRRLFRRDPPGTDELEPLAQLREERPPLFRNSGVGKDAEAEDGVVQIARIAQFGPRLRAHLGDGVRIERSDLAGLLGVQGPPDRDGAGAPLFQRRVVEIRPGCAVQDLVRERARLRKVARHHAQGARGDLLQEHLHSREVHRLVQAIPQGLVDERVIDGLERSRRGVVLARYLGRKHLREQIVGAHPLQVEGHLLAAALAQERERAGRVPPPAHAEHRRLHRGLREDLFDARGMDEVEDGVERKAVLRSEREQHRIVRRGGLQLEIEGAAKALAQREPVGAVVPRSVGSVDDELHAARFVEEALGYQHLLRGQDAQRRATRREIPDELLRARGAEPALPLPEGLRLGRPFQERLDDGAQFAHRARQLGAPPRRFAVPEGDGGRDPVRVLDPDPARLDPPDAPRVVAEEEDVSGQALYREVLVEMPDEGSFRLGNHLVLRRVRDGSAVLQRHEPRGATTRQRPGERVAVQPRRHRAALPPGDALGVHADHRVEIRPREVAVGPGAPHPPEQIVLADLLASRPRDDLLREDVERMLGQSRLLEPSLAQAAHDGGAFDQLVAREREEPRLGHPAPLVARPSDALQGDGEVVRRIELHHEVHRSDVDAQLQRGRRHHCLRRAALQLLLGGEADGPREAAVMGGHLIFSEPLGEGVGDALDLPAGVHEDEGGCVLPGEVRDPIAYLVALLLRGDRRQIGPRHLDADVELPSAADVDDRAARRAVLPDARRADQEAGDLLDRPLRGGKPDADRPRGAQRLEALEAERQVRAALVARHRVDLVHDHRPRRAQQLASALAGEEHEERFRRRHQHVGRRCSLCPQRVALLNSEPVLLVDDDETEIGELHVFLEQRVGADDNAGVTAHSVQ